MKAPCHSQHPGSRREFWGRTASSSISGCLKSQPNKNSRTIISRALGCSDGVGSSKVRDSQGKLFVATH